MTKSLNFIPSVAHERPEMEDDAREIVHSAYTDISNWIDENLDRLVNEFTRAIRTDYHELKDEVVQLERRDRSSRESLVTILKEMEVVLGDIGDLRDLTDSAKERLRDVLLELVITVRKDLQDREENWQQILSGIEQRIERAAEIFEGSPE